MDWSYYIGVITVLYCAYIVMRELYNMIRMMYFPALLEMKKYGEWALVTGCTDGIGKQYCLQMIPNCSKFILIGRNSKKLDILHDEMKQICSTVQVEKLIIDFATFNDYDSLEDSLKSKDIGVFINSVGVSYPLPQPLHETDKTYPGLMWEHLNVNLRSATRLTKIISTG